tara:strand:- start:316 stop:1227 length:912 start_codon:yes stop_codon:yes gene_type:complete
MAYTKQKGHGVTPGIISIPHTFGSMLQLHIHFHVLVTCGGIHPKTGIWKDINHFPIAYLKKVFRAKFLNKLRALHRNNKFSFSDKALNDYCYFNAILKKSFSQYVCWHGHISTGKKKQKYDPMSDGNGQVASTMISYSLRYLCRLPISEHNIVDYKNGIVYWYPKKSKYESGIQHRRLNLKKTPVHKFMALLIQHVPDKREKTVYYAGLYSPHETSKALHEKAITHFNKRCHIRSLQKKGQPHLMTWGEMRKWHSKRAPPVDPSICPSCNKKMIFLRRCYFSMDFLKKHTIVNNQIVPLKTTT